MTTDFVRLQKLIEGKVVELRLKKKIKDNFYLWLYWYSKRKKPRFIWVPLYFTYWLFSSEWFWLPFSAVLALEINKWFLLGLVFPFTIRKILSPIGQGFLLYDAQNDEALFDGLWENKVIGIVSVMRRERLTYNDGVPDIIIDSTIQSDWREQIKNKKFD